MGSERGRMLNEKADGRGRWWGPRLSLSALPPRRVPGSSGLAAGLPQPSSRVVFIYLPAYLHVGLQPQRSGIVFLGHLPVFIQLGPKRLFNKHPLTQSPPFPSSFKLKVNLSNHVYKFKTHHSH